MKDMKDIKIGDRVRFGRNTGEYRGQFDKLNIAMVLVGNRLYYVAFENIEKLGRQENPARSTERLRSKSR